jgi:glycosyltransferase involved in cell wall biosynthesis
MTKKNKSIINGKYYPLVSVCTPTFNRRPFIPIMFECFKNQTYPKNRIEWIIVDDGTDKIKDLVDKSNIPQIKYFSVNKKMALGEKRNYMHKHATGSIIVYMDDDDYYPPERISHAVERLTEDKEALCAGSSEIYIYFKHIQKMYQFGPYGPNHATAGTFAFKSELLKISKYDDTAALAEEKSFLKNYTIPFVQLDPLKTILVFSHIHNTFDKRRMLENPHPQYCKESPKTVDLFIRNDYESNIKKYFMEDIDSILNKYDYGQPKYKPDVLEQIKKIEKEREVLNAQNAQNAPQIMMSRPGEQPVALSIQDILNIVQQQQENLQSFSKQLMEKDKTIADLNKRINEKDKIIKTLQKEKGEPKAKEESKPESILKSSSDFTNIEVTPNNPKKHIEFKKTEPEIFINVND